MVRYLKIMMVVAIGVLWIGVDVQALDFDSYRKLVNESMKDLIGGTIPDPAALLARQEQLMALGIVGATEHGKADPADAKLMELVVQSAESFKAMTPEELEAKWGDEGTGADGIGRHLKDIGQFVRTRNYLDIVVHPARAYTLIKAWQATRDTQNLDQAKGELNEVLEHIEHIQKEP